MRSGDLYRLDWNSLEREIDTLNEQVCSFCLFSLKQFLLYSPLSTLKKRRQSATTPIPPQKIGYIGHNFSSSSQTAPLFSPTSKRKDPPPLPPNKVPPKHQLELSYFIMRT